MANGHGGARKGAGRTKGAKAVVTEEAIKRAGEGETPLEYMLRIMRDPSEPHDRRDKMALGAAPYVHAKAMELTGADGQPLSVEILRFSEDDTASA
jgi:hypothetical protein